MNPKKQKEKERRRARKLADEAWEAVSAENLDLAEKIIRRAVQTQEDNPVLWNDLGTILCLRGKNDEAEPAFRTALSLAPTFAEVYAKLAAMRLSQNMLRDAVSLQSQAVHHAPQNKIFAEQLQAYQDRLAAKFPAPENQPEFSGSAPEPISGGELMIEPKDLRRVLPTHIDWHRIGEHLTRDGCVLIPALLDAAECASLRELFDDDSRFAKTVVMDRPNFGRGTYRYFAPPMPEIVDRLRQAVYPYVAEIANGWQGLLGEPNRYPAVWEEFREQCAHAGQTTPTPILLKYLPGGFNALHRDLRGEVFFPIQMAVVLSPRTDSAKNGFQGGDFIFSDVPEGKKSARREIAAGLGDAVLFCTRDRLVHVGGAYGLQPVKHGVTEITAGERLVLGVPFHEYR